MAMIGGPNHLAGWVEGISVSITILQIQLESKKLRGYHKSLISQVLVTNEFYSKPDAYERAHLTACTSL